MCSTTPQRSVGFVWFPGNKGSIRLPSAVQSQGQHSKALIYTLIAQSFFMKFRKAVRCPVGQLTAFPSLKQQIRTYRQPAEGSDLFVVVARVQRQAILKFWSPLTALFCFSVCRSLPFVAADTCHFTYFFVYFLSIAQERRYR